jgi:hypothetical protein
MVPGEVAGASAGLLASAERRAVLGEGAAVFAATVAGRGVPCAGACCSAAVAERCVAVLAGDSSPVVATCVLAAGAVSTRVAAAMLGALLVLRVIDGAAVGFAVAVGANCPVCRVMREATWSVRAVFGSADGNSVDRGAVTSAVARCSELVCGVRLASVALVCPAVALGVTTLACVRTSGRSVARACRLGTGVCDWAMVGCAGLSS